MTQDQMREGTVICFDYGLARIGVAQGNFLLKEAHPLGIIYATTKTERWTAIDRLINDWQPVCFVVGMPLHQDDQESEMTKVCRNFALKLAGRYKRHVYMVDERYSSAVVESESGEPIDDESAAIILDQFFLEPEHQLVR